MAGRVRTTKTLSQRIDHEYFKRLGTIPRWRRILSLALTVVGLGWLSWSTVAGSGEVFNAGPLSHPHKILEGNCATCHAGTAAFGRKVEDQACLTCHDGPKHQQQETFTPSCLSCHVEHKGSGSLTAVADSSCTQCHATLITKDGKITVAAEIKGFDASHPEFKLLTSRRTDPGTIKFGHAGHMKADLRGPNGPVQLECSTCHILRKDGSVKTETMMTATFKDNCESCHRLEFSKKIDRVLPHDKPEVALAFAREAFRTYINAHPGEVNLVEPAMDPRVVTPPAQPAGNAANWIAQRMDETQRLMTRKTCVECHSLGASNGSAFPELAKSQVTNHWLDKAKFDHAAHQLVSCASCHEKAVQSKDTSDVLIPGVETCKQCHNTNRSAASVNCSECHVYHDWSKAKPVDSKRTINQLLHR